MTKTELKIKELEKYCDEVKVFRNKFCVGVHLKNFLNKKNVTLRYPSRMSSNIVIHMVYKKLDELIIAYKLI